MTFIKCSLCPKECAKYFVYTVPRVTTPQHRQIHHSYFIEEKIKA